MSIINTFILGISNMFLIKGKGFILIDTGTGADRATYGQLFADMNVNPEEIGLIIISHGHSDHFAGLHELKELTGAPVLCHQNAVQALRTGKNPPVKPRNELGKRVLEMIKGNAPISRKSVEPDIIVNSVFDLSGYGVAGSVIPTPGHSDCSITVLLDTGEALVADMLVESPFSGEPCVAYFADDEQALFRNINMLLAKAHVFYSGHGGPFKREEILKLCSCSADAIR